MSGIHEEITRLRERCEAYKAQVKDGADVIAGLRERLAEAEATNGYHVVKEAVARASAAEAKLQDAGKELDGLADWLNFTHGMNASLAHIPEMAKHQSALMRWERAARSLKGASNA